MSRMSHHTDACDVESQHVGLRTCRSLFVDMHVCFGMIAHDSIAERA